MTKVAVSILDADFANLGKVVKQAVAAGVDWIHLDIMDGRFVPNLSFGAPVIKKLRPVTEAFFDAHLMVERPSVLIDDLAAAGADSITMHLECGEKIENLIAQIKKHKKKVGISIRPRTKVAKLIPYLPMIDLVLIMSVEPGFGGQAFQKNAINRIAELKELVGRKKVLIAVDGGINAVTAPACVAAGADVLMVGNYVWCARDKRAAVRKLKSAMNE